LKLSEFDFELNRGVVAEGGVEPVSIIDVFEEGADVASSVFERRAGLAVDLLVFEGAHEALGLGVVVGVTGAANVEAQAAGLQSIGVGSAGVLHAGIGVVIGPVRWSASAQPTTLREKVSRTTASLT